MLSVKFNIIKKSIAILSMAMLFFSCKEPIKKSLYSDEEDIPISQTENFHLIYTLKGNKVLDLTAPFMQDFSNNKDFKFQFFPKKFKVILINEKKQTTTITADKAYIYKNPDITELIGNVIIKNEQNASLETSHLFWDSKNNHIFGEEKTVISKGNEKIEGIGFDSSMDFKNVRINKITGQLTLKTNKNED